MKKRILVVVLLLISFFLQAAEEKMVRFVVTSDLHGAVLGYNFKKQEKISYGLGALNTYLENLNDPERKQTILLDVGDLLQGSSGTAYYNTFPGEKGHIYSRMMNRLKYDAAVVGNHDLETGHQIYDRVKREFNFPWMAANLLDEKTKAPYFEPYTILEKEGLKIAVLGLTTLGFTDWIQADSYTGIIAEDMLTAAKKWVKIIQEKEKPDLLIGLFHSGLKSKEFGYLNGEIVDFDVSEEIAYNIPGFDVVFFGHDHKPYRQIINNRKGESVLLLNPGANGYSAGEVIIRYDSLGKKTMTSQLIDMTSLEVSDQLVKDFIDDIAHAEEYLLAPIYKNPYAFELKDAIFGPSLYMSIMGNLFKNIADADIGIAAPLSIDDGFDAGIFTRLDLFLFYPYENILEVLELTGHEIKDILEYSSEFWFETMTGPDSHLLNFQDNQQGVSVLSNYYYNFDCAAGIRYQVDVSKSPGNRITIFSMDNEEQTPFSLDKTYKVAINSYRTSGGGGYLNHLKMDDSVIAARTLYQSKQSIRADIIDYLSTNPDLSKIQEPNWNLVPEDWVKEAQERDKKLLYPPETINIRVIGTSDLHGNFFDYDHIRKRETIGGFPRIYTYVENERKKEGQNVVLLNGGDVLQGQLPVYYYNYVDTRSRYMPAVFFNKLKTDASVLGNHDIEAGKFVFERFIQQMRSDVLAANLVYQNTKEPYVKPYTCIYKEGVKIAILGLTTPIQTQCVITDLVEELEIGNMLDAARHWMNHIREEEKPDLVIGLFHAGISEQEIRDSGYWDCGEAGSVLQIAREVKGFDAIFLGHLHTLMRDRIANAYGDSVWLIEAGYGGYYLSVVDFEIKKGLEKSQIVKTSAHIADISKVEPSEEIMRFLESEKKLMDDIANEPVANLLDTIYNVNAFFGPSFFVDVIHKVQLEHTKADVSFASPLSSNVVIPPGAITFADIMRIYRFENTLVTMRMTGEEIKNYLEYSYDLWVQQVKSPNDQMLRTKARDTAREQIIRQFIVPQYYFDSGAGMDYEVDVTKPAGQRVNITRMWDGSKFDLQKFYTVVNNSYRVSGAGGHIELSSGIPKDMLQSRIVAVYNKQIRELIREEFVKEKVVQSLHYTNWKFVPEDYVKIIEAREKRTLE